MDRPYHLNYSIINALRGNHATDEDPAGSCSCCLPHWGV
jgi:hypothetical protein